MDEGVTEKHWSGGIIVLEGPDCVGKTTFANELMDFVGRDICHYMHLTYRWPDKMWEYHLAAIKRAIRMFTEEGKLVIIDRWWPSEALYAHVYRNGSRWPMAGRMLHRLMLRYAGVYVCCIPENFVAQQQRFAARCKAGGEMYKDVREVTHTYIDFLVGHRCSDVGGYAGELTRTGGFMRSPLVHGYHIGDAPDHLENHMTAVMSKMLRLQANQFPWFCDASLHNYLGAPLTPSPLVIIGDRVNPKYKLYYPFIDYRHDSLFLTKAIHHLGLSEEQLIWFNAFNADGSSNSELIHKTLKALPSPTVLVLGDQVEKELQLKLPYAKVRHPVYYERYVGGHWAYGKSIGHAVSGLVHELREISDAHELQRSVH